MEHIIQETGKQVSLLFATGKGRNHHRKESLFFRFSHSARLGVLLNAAPTITPTSTSASFIRFFTRGGRYIGGRILIFELPCFFFLSKLWQISLWFASSKTSLEDDKMKIKKKSEGGSVSHMLRERTLTAAINRRMEGRKEDYESFLRWSGQG